MCFSIYGIGDYQHLASCWATLLMPLLLPSLSKTTTTPLEPTVRSFYMSIVLERGPYR